MQQPEHHPAIELEVCVERVSDALDCIAAGASRIELNTALELSGLTPSIADCQLLRGQTDVPILAMLRPHDAGFVYTAAEQSILLDQCQPLLETGVDGIVFGALTKDQRIDLPLLSRIADLCRSRQLVFHRAFDELHDQFQGLQELVELGVCRVLTSGGAKCAWSGVPRLRELVQIARDRIEILPGGGITSLNAVNIVQQTGCRAVHGSFRRFDRGRVSPDLHEIALTRRLLSSSHA